MDTVTTPPSSMPAGGPAQAHGPRLAGDLAIWFFILAELLAFGVFFAAYAFARAKNIELFAAEQAERTARAELWRYVSAARFPPPVR